VSSRLSRLSRCPNGNQRLLSRPISGLATGPGLSMWQKSLLQALSVGRGRCHDGSLTPNRPGLGNLGITVLTQNTVSTVSCGPACGPGRRLESPSLAAPSPGIAVSRRSLSRLSVRPSVSALHTHSPLAARRSTSSIRWSKRPGSTNIDACVCVTTARDRRGEPGSLILALSPHRGVVD
jgi:hypothetical protein